MFDVLCMTNDVGTWRATSFSFVILSMTKDLFT